MLAPTRHVDIWWRRLLICFLEHSTVIVVFRTVDYLHEGYTGQGGVPSVAVFQRQPNFYSRKDTYSSKKTTENTVHLERRAGHDLVRSQHLPPIIFESRTSRCLR